MCDLGAKRLSLGVFPRGLIPGWQAGPTEEEVAAGSWPATASAAQAGNLGRGSSLRSGPLRTSPPVVGCSRSRGRCRAFLLLQKGVPVPVTPVASVLCSQATRCDLFSAPRCLHLQSICVSPVSGDWRPDLFLPPSSSSHPPLLPPATSERGRRPRVSRLQSLKASCTAPPSRRTLPAPAWMLSLAPLLFGTRC